MAADPSSVGRLSDIKKKLGLKAREDIYGVFKYNSKALALGLHQQSNRLSAPVFDTCYQFTNSFDSTMSSAAAANKPVPKPRRPPPPKPPPYKPVREKGPPTATNDLTPPKEPPPRSVSPSVLMKVDQRPRLDTPVYETTKEVESSPAAPPPRTPPSRLSPKPYYPTNELDNTGVVVVSRASEQKRGGLDYEEVSIKGLHVAAPVESKPLDSELDNTGVVRASEQKRGGLDYEEVSIKGLHVATPVESKPLHPEYHHTSHVLSKQQQVPQTFHEYSSLNVESTVSDTANQAKVIPEYAQIDLRTKKPKLFNADHDMPSEMVRTTPPHTPPFISHSRHSKSSSPESKTDRMSPKPPIPAKPAALKRLSPHSSPVRSSSNETAAAAVGNQPTMPTSRPHSNLCEIDIDAIVKRSPVRITPPFVVSEPNTSTTVSIDDEIHTVTSGTPNATTIQTSATPPVSRSTKHPPVRHIYDDIDEVKSQLTSQAIFTAQNDLNNNGNGRRIKEPPKRRAPPPPNGSPPIARRKISPPSSKNLTLGRKPRTALPHLDNSSPEESPKLPKKMSLTSASPSIKSKFKTFFKSGSRDDSFLRGSFRRNKNKRTTTTTVANDTIGTENSKAKTLPNRPRGKSVDPYMEGEVLGGYSVITMEFDDDNIDDQLCVPYTVIDVNAVTLRDKKGNKDKSLRRSRSMDHLYDYAHVERKREPSPLTVESPPKTTPTPTSDGESHIYAAIDKSKTKKNDTEKREEENDNCHNNEESLSPPPPVPPFNAHVYAVVSKSVDENSLRPSVGVAPDTPSVTISKPASQQALPTSQVESPRVNRRAPPPAPAPYSGPKPPAISTTPTKAASKYSHLLTLTPPTHTPPTPPTDKQPIKATLSDVPPQRIKIHDYEQIDFDDPLSSLSPVSSLPRSTLIGSGGRYGNVRELKPKDRPAPAPPHIKKTRSMDDTSTSSSRSTPSEHSPNKTANKRDPLFLFTDSRVTSFIEAGDSIVNPTIVISPSASSSTISSIMETAEYDSDVSTDWDPSSHEEEEEEEEIPKTPKSKIFYIAQEILTTERTFVKGLGLLHNDFRKHMLSANSAHEKVVVTEETMTHILSNIGSLYMLNSDFLKELEERMAKWDTDPRLGDIFVKRAPYLKMYSQYISNFDTALKTLDEQQKKNSLFAHVVKEFEAETKCANLTVAAYLLETVQRIPRYKMLLADYIKHLPEGSTDKEDSEKALSIITSVATHVNETIRQMDNFKKTIEVSKKLIGDVGDSLLSPHRKLLKEGELTKSSRKEKQPRMFFLFTDLLIYASAIPPANNTYRVIKKIPLDGMKVQQLDDPELKYGFQIISTSKSFRLDASSIEERQQWLQAFETAIKDHTQRLQSRLIKRQSLMIIDTQDQSNKLGSLAPPWLPDSAVSMCQLCGIHFTVTRRRHHCRACGLIFCGECSSYLAPLAYKKNKLSRVCQTCYCTLTGDTTEAEDFISEQNSKRRPLKSTSKKISMPSVLTEVKARDQNAQISGYLFYREDKSRQWKKKWFVVYDLVMYEFKRHEDVSAQKTIPLPSYTVTSPATGVNDPLVFSLQHSGAGRTLFKVENESQLDNWLEVLYKAIKGEVDNT